MKKLTFLLLIMTLMIPATLPARENIGMSAPAFNKIAMQDYLHIDVNQISAWVTNYGSLFRHPITGDSGFEYPAGAGTFAIYASGLWVGARVNGSPRVAIAEYSYEYKPGKIINGVPDDWDKSRYGLYKWLGTDTPDAEAVEDGAPEKLIGDQYLWSVYNDGDASYHTAINTAPLMVEVQQSVFGFARTGPLGNTVFVKWLVVNKSGTKLEDTYITVWCDPDVGGSGDDLVGCDTTLSLGYCYNGDNNDTDYGEAPPATGIDFFQGPIVTGEATDTAYVSGMAFPGYKNLPMTSFVYYNNNSQNNGDPQTGPEVYNFMQSRWRDGTPITEGGDGMNPNNPPTKYMFPGDPASGTGWLDSAPADRRFMMTTGPFTMEPFEDTNGNGKEDIGEPGVQEIVVGVMVARGADNLASVSLLKQYDELAQMAYDLNFNLASPPTPPRVEVTTLDQQIILNWSNEDPLKGTTYHNVEAYDAKDPLVVIEDPNDPPDTTYTFQGYLVYQYDYLDRRNAKLIANFDVNDGVAEVRDFVLDEPTGEYLEKLVWKGNDGGLKRYFSITNDQFSASSLPRLVNGKRYWFGVVAWGYNANSSPKSIYSPLIPGVNFLEVTPQGNAIGTKYTSEIEGKLISASKTGESDGTAFGVVVDPSKVTGHTYTAQFDKDENGEIFWRLMNSGNVVLDNIYHQSTDSADAAFPVIHGIQFKILGPPPGINPLHLGMAYDPPDNADLLQGWDWNGGTRWISGEADNGGPDGQLFNGLINGFEFFGSTCSAADYVDVELRFAGDVRSNQPKRWQKAYLYRRDMGYAYNGLGDVPFTAWDISDPDNPRQINICFVEMDGIAGENNPEVSVPANGVWDMGWHELPADTGYGEKGGREYLFIMASDYDPSGTRYDDDVWGPEQDVMYAIWPHSRNDLPFLHDQFNLQIFASKVNSPGVTYTFQTDTAVVNPVVNDAELAKKEIEKINVFPNPYYGTHTGERDPLNKWVEFTHLPPTCKIRIFNLAGVLIRTLERQNISDRTWEKWDLLNESKLPVASGIYIYHVEIPGIGEKIGKMALFVPQERLDTF